VSFFFFFENRAVYEIMWKNTVEPSRPQKKIWRMRFSHWLPEAKNTHSEHVILISFPLSQWLHENASMLRYTCIACLANSILISKPWLMWPITAPKATCSATLENKYTILSCDIPVALDNMMVQDSTVEHN